MRLSLVIVLSSIAFVQAQTCGPAAGGAACEEGYCCSEWGYCGDTPEHCSLPTCQSAYGACRESIAPSDAGAINKKPAGASVFLAQCGPDGGGASCAAGQCCSKWGWCGSSDAYCAAESCNPMFGVCAEDAAKSAPAVVERHDYECGINNQVCADGTCCSRSGWCGAAAAFCQLDLGCQSAYGVCWDAALDVATAAQEPTPVEQQLLRRVQTDEPSQPDFSTEALEDSSETSQAEASAGDSFGKGGVAPASTRLRGSAQRPARS